MDALKLVASCDISEEARLTALYQYDVLDTPPEESFDRITRLAKLTLQMPIAMVSLVDRHRQWFKSRQGTDSAETPRSISFCTHTIRTDEPFIVQDTFEDKRFCDSPLVTGAPHIRAYVGVPLRTPSGHNIGALCVSDTRPRHVTKDQVNVLKDLARLVVDELELRLIASVDGLTGALTSRSFIAEANKEFARARRYSRDLGCIMLDIDHFKKINDTYGHAVGDRVLTEVSALCKSMLRATDVIGRVGGEEFAILIPEVATGTKAVAKMLRNKVAALTIADASGSISLTASFGATILMGADRDFGQMRARADGALYQAKNAGRNAVRWAGSSSSCVQAGDDADIDAGR